MVLVKGDYMKKEKIIASALAGLLLFNTLPGCSNSKNNNNVEGNTISEEKSYSTNNLWVKIYTNELTGEDELYLYSGDYEVFSLDSTINGMSLVSSAKLIEYISMDEYKKSYTISELRVMCENFRKEFHNVDSEVTIPDFENVKSKEDDKTFDLNDLWLIEYENEDKTRELYFGKSAIIGYYEIFTDTNIIAYKLYSPMFFIPTKHLKYSYTESELKVLLEYIRDVYHNNRKLYETNAVLKLD